jgi:hypothetical protein
MNSNLIIPAAMALHRLTGVTGLLLLKGHTLLAANVPFPQAKTDALVTAVRRLAEGYRQVKREVSTVWLEFQHVRMALVQKQDASLVLLLSAKADADTVLGAASVFLAEYADRISQMSPEPQSLPADGVEELIVTKARATEVLIEKAEATINVWPDARRGIERLLSKVMGRAQAVNLIDRSISESGVSDPYRMTREELRSLGSHILKQVPNLARQRSLEAELNALWEDLHT